MNVSQYIKSNQCKDLFIQATEYPSYIHVNSVFIVVFGTVVVDKQLDTIAMAERLNGKIIINSIVNIKKYYHGNYYDLIPGSFVGTHIKDMSNVFIHNIEVNGYVMHNGVLS